MNIVSKKETLLGTEIEIKLPEKFSSFFSNCFSELKRIENTYSRFLDTSELSKLNANLGVWHTISDEFLYLIEKSEQIKKQTDGNFDITLKSTLDNLGYDKNYSFKEKKETKTLIQKIKEVLPLISIDKKNKKVLLRKQIEFGGCGKGFALDCASKLLDSKGVTHYYINAGGDIFAKQDGPPWEILLEHPDDSSRVIGKIILNKKAIAGSNPNKRKWGKHHHLINAKTKLPANDVKAIFVIAPLGIEADAYATALFTAGFENAILISQHLNIEILMISPENKMYLSPGFEVDLYG